MSRPIRPRPILRPVGPSIAYVVLTQGRFSLIDSDMAAHLGRLNWSAWLDRTSGSYYAVSKTTTDGKRQKLSIHKEVLRPEDGLVSDHIHGNTLDNRRAALRAVTASQNAINRRLNRRSKSGYRGVGVRGRRFSARITIAGKQAHLGTFATAEAAHSKYMEASAIHYGEFARTA